MELVEAKELNLQKTELGEIPSDWIASTFGETFTGFSSGMTPFRGVLEYYKGDIPWITSGELNYNIITDTWEKITEEAVIKTNLKIHPVGTFLMAITGLEAAGTRGSCAITGIKSTTNQSCMALFPIQGKTTTEYLYHFYVRYGNELAFKYCQGTKQQSYTGRIAKRLPINLPPTIEEQKAIAKVLSDTDALIQALEKKIDKKKLIKKGMMQKLLTPKEGWFEKQISEISNSFAGGTPSTSKNEYWNGNILWLQSGRCQNNTIKKSKNEITITSIGLAESAAKLINPGSVLVAITGATCGNIGYLNFSAAANQSVVAIEPNKEVNGKFLYYLMLTKRNDILTLQTGSAQGGTNLKSIKGMLIKHPKLDDQNEIAEILSDIDNEIELLVTKLVKYKLAKQGMMQQLLTGKIRLV
jgi:type I restriction enzyme S subunit